MKKVQPVVHRDPIVRTIFVSRRICPSSRPDVLTIRPTKMLARRLAIALPPAPPAVANRVADWCEHEFRVGRYRYLMFCSTASLYPVVGFGPEVGACLQAMERASAVGASGRLQAGSCLEGAQRPQAGCLRWQLPILA